MADLFHVMSLNGSGVWEHLQQSQNMWQTFLPTWPRQNDPAFFVRNNKPFKTWLVGNLRVFETGWYTIDDTHEMI